MCGEDSRGALELVDASGLLPALPRLPGLTKWHVIDDEMRRVPDGAALRTLDPHARRRLRAGMFPPRAGASAPPLQRCLRFLPHLADTGAFFVALLRKVAPLPAGRHGRGRGGGGAAAAAPCAAPRAPTPHALRPADAGLRTRGGAEARKQLRVPARVERFLRLDEGGTLSVVHAGATEAELQEDVEALVRRLGERKRHRETRQSRDSEKARERRHWCH